MVAGFGYYEHCPQRKEQVKETLREDFATKEAYQALSREIYLLKDNVLRLSVSDTLSEDNVKNIRVNTTRENCQLEFYLNGTWHQVKEYKGDSVIESPDQKLPLGLKKKHCN